jgi:hypothetical protein
LRFSFLHESRFGEEWKEDRRNLVWNEARGSWEGLLAALLERALAEPSPAAAADRRRPAEGAARRARARRPQSWETAVSARWSQWP